ncbi:hypothetical protein B0H16DRAFT_1744919 [Mycena metata]|uniref:Uncharacterized protein n=1 Tax=Mycena metata TaxID=1033252 RepID=A0AAD7H4G8_9AGAR|nr:hypothetical protein B0H16DRAFT_1744919 [Mycena metata]
MPQPSPVPAVTTATEAGNAVPPKAKPLTKREIYRLANRATASARYRERHRDEVREAARLRAAQRRANLATASSEVREEVKQRARDASARYRARHREELALKQRKVRKRAHIAKHGIHLYLERRYSAPKAPPEEEPEDGDDSDEPQTADEHTPWDYNYIDPCSKRC